MKKSIFILLVIISIFIASCAPQVTVTSAERVTVTLPAATQSPEPSASPTAVYTPTPAQETIPIGGGLSVVLGEKVDGGIVIDKFVADSSLTPERQAEKLADTDYTRVGYEQGDLLWMQNEKGKTVLVDAADHESVIAEFKRAKNAGGTTEVVWNWDKMIDPETGESILFKIKGIKTFDLGRYRLPVDNDSLLEFQRSIRNKEAKDFAELHEVFNYSASDGAISSLDGKKVIGDVFEIIGIEGMAKDATDGVLYFGVNDQVWRIYVTNFTFTRIGML